MTDRQLNTTITARSERGAIIIETCHTGPITIMKDEEGSERRLYRSDISSDELCTREGSHPFDVLKDLDIHWDVGYRPNSFRSWISNVISQDAQDAFRLLDVVQRFTHEGFRMVRINFGLFFHHMANVYQWNRPIYWPIDTTVFVTQDDLDYYYERSRGVNTLGFQGKYSSAEHMVWFSLEVLWILYTRGYFTCSKDCHEEYVTLLLKFFLGSSLIHAKRAEELVGTDKFLYRRPIKSYGKNMCVQTLFLMMKLVGQMQGNSCKKLQTLLTMVSKCNIVHTIEREDKRPKKRMRQEMFVPVGDKQDDGYGLLLDEVDVNDSVAEKDTVTLAEKERDVKEEMEKSLPPIPEPGLMDKLGGYVGGKLYHYGKAVWKGAEKASAQQFIADTMKGKEPDPLDKCVNSGIEVKHSIPFLEGIMSKLSIILAPLGGGCKMILDQIKTLVNSIIDTYKQADHDSIYFGIGLCVLVCTVTLIFFARSKIANSISLLVTAFTELCKAFQITVTTNVRKFVKFYFSPRKDVEGNPSMEQQGPGTAAMGCIVGMVSSYLFGADLTPPKVSYLNGLNRLGKDYGEVIGFAFDNMKKVVGAAFDHFMDIPITAERKERKIFTAVVTEVKEIALLARNASKFLKDESLVKRVDYLFKMILNNPQILKSETLSHSEKALWIQAMKIVEGWYHQKETVSFLAKSRPETVWLHMMGQAGVGKTLITETLVSLVYQLVTGKTFSNANRYERDMNSEFMEGYIEQWVTTIDDIYQTRDIAMRTKTSMEIIHFVSSQPTPCTMPGLDEKGTTFYNSKLLYTTSNVVGVPDNLGITEQEAWVRRCKLPTRATVNPEYAHADGKLDMSKLVIRTTLLDLYNKVWNFRVHSSIASNSHYPGYLGELNTDYVDYNFEGIARITAERIIQAANYAKTLNEFLENPHWDVKPIMQQQGWGSVPKWIRDSVLSWWPDREANDIEYERVYFVLTSTSSSTVGEECGDIMTKINTTREYQERIDEAISIVKANNFTPDAFLDWIENANHVELKKLLFIDMSLIERVLVFKVLFAGGHTIPISRIVQLTDFSSLEPIYNHYVINKPTIEIYGDRSYTWHMKQSPGTWIGGIENYVLFKQAQLYANNLLWGENVRLVGVTFLKCNASTYMGKMLMNSRVMLLLSGVIMALSWLRILWIMVFGKQDPEEARMAAEDDESDDEVETVFPKRNRRKSVPATPMNNESSDRRFERNNQRTYRNMNFARTQHNYVRAKAFQQQGADSGDVMEQEPLFHIQRKIMKNNIMAHLYFEDKTMPCSVNFQFLVGSLAITAAHSFKWGRGLKKIVLRPVGVQKGSCGGQLEYSTDQFTLEPLMVDGEVSDLMIVVFHYGLSMTNLMKYLPNTIDSRGLTPIRLYQIGCSETQVKWGEIPSTGCEFTTIATHRDGKEEYFCNQLYVENCRGSPGHCGFPYINPSKQAKFRLIGIHTAGEDSASCCTVILKKYFKKFMEDPKLAPSVADHPPMVKSLMVQEFQAPITTLPGLDSEAVFKRTPFMSDKTNIVPSFIQNGIVDAKGKLYKCPFEIKRAPAKLGVWTDENGQKRSPYREGLEKGFGTCYQKGYSKAQMDLFMEKDNFDGLIPPAKKRKLFILTLKEAVLGVPSLGIKPIDFKTAAGFPWKQFGITKLNDKAIKALFKLTLDENDLIIDVEFTDLFMEMYNYKMACLKTGQIPPMYSTQTLKDELRDLDRIKNGKTRVFDAADIVDVIIHRRYFADFVSLIEASRDTGPVQVGVNVHSYKWAQLRLRLKNLSRKAKEKGFILGDVSRWDKSIPLILAYALGFWLEDWYEWETDWKIACLILIGMLQTFQISPCGLFRSFFGVPSGCYLTSIFNSIANFWFHKVIFKHLVPDEYKYRFLELVVLFLYGDDSIGSVAEEVREYFNMKTIGKVFLEWFNIVYTSPCKGAQDEEFVAEDELVFLKRKFRMDDHFCFAPLDWDSIESIPLWMNFSKNAVEQKAKMRDACGGACLEAFHHGENSYERMRRILNERLRLLSLEVIAPTYQEMMSRWACPTGAYYQ